MTNKPFVSHNTNIYNESSFSKAPATLGENPVIIEQLSNRQIIDKNSTSIHKNVTIPLCNPAPQAQPRINILQGEKNMFPGGISYTFNPLAQNCAFQYNTKPLCTTSPYKHFRTNNQPRSEINCNVNSYQQPSLTLEQQIALKQLEKEGLELVLFAERLKRNPYSLKFHQTQQTSTTDLSNGPSQICLSKGTPDFNNVCGEMSSLKKDIQTISTHEVQTSDPACLYPSKKKLVLKKSPDLKKQEPSIGKDNDEASDESENKNSKTSKKRKRSSKKCKKHNKRRKCSSSKSRNARKLNSDQIKKRNTNRKCSINCKCSDKESSDSDSESDSDFSEDSLSN
ncbi:hypothetical protein FQA39_LY13978 [Lamprigera yunnana]|nr:hypothetical protein FQA39_LY13978 [Lamprigera yunnana]